MVADKQGMKPVSAKTSPALIGTKSILVVDKEIHRRRRIEFLIRMAGHDPHGVVDELEAVNWLHTVSAEKPAALVVLPSLNEQGRAVLHAAASVRMQIPVVDVTMAAWEDRNKTYSDIVISEEHLLETLRNLIMTTASGAAHGAGFNLEESK